MAAQINGYISNLEPLIINTSIVHLWWLLLQHFAKHRVDMSLIVGKVCRQLVLRYFKSSIKRGYKLYWHYTGLLTDILVMSLIQHYGIFFRTYKCLVKKIRGNIFIINSIVRMNDVFLQIVTASFLFSYIFSIV